MSMQNQNIEVFNQIS